MESSQVQSTPTVKFSRHGKHKNPNYHREYYRQNREKLLTYSHDYYGVKKTLANFSKKAEKNTAKNGVKKKFLTGVNNITFDNAKKEVFFWQQWEKWKRQIKKVNRKRTRREILEECLDKELIRLATVLTEDSKCKPTKKGWTCPNFKEWLTKKRLLELHKQWSIRCGVRIGRKFLSFLDVDIEQEKFPSWVKKRLRVNIIWFLKRIKVCYIETKRGFHIPILSKELLPNEIVYHIDSWKKVKRIIGSIQSKGKFVVGFDSSDKVLVANEGKCFWQIENQAELKETLAKFFLLVGNQEIKAPKIVKKTCRVLTKLLPQFKFSIQVRVLSIHETFINRLGEMMRKIRYLSNVGKNGYFLLNDYQKPRILEQLPRGKILNLELIQGEKHAFFNRIY